jgi:hypothetical protein
MKYNFAKNCLLTLVIIMSLAGCAQFQTTDGVKIEKSKYAFVFDSVSRLGLNSVSLYGHYPLKRKAYLLAKDQNQICEVITAEHRKYQGEANYFSFTTLKVLPTCPRVGYSVAVFEPVSNYQIVAFQPISDASSISSLDILVRNSSATKELSTKAQDLVAGDEDYPLNDLFAKVHRFECANVQGYIVSYAKGEKYSYGPRFVVFGDSVHAFTGWCSYPYMRAFMLNNIFYIESGSYCCNCGITIMELYKIEQNKVTLVHSDASESD